MIKINDSSRDNLYDGMDMFDSLRVKPQMSALPKMSKQFTKTPKLNATFDEEENFKVSF